MEESERAEEELEWRKEEEEWTGQSVEEGWRLADVHECDSGCECLLKVI